jgi:methionyl-tRNA formyltransferase
MSRPSVLFLGKNNDEGTARALDFCRSRFPSVTACLGGWKEPAPPVLETWQGDYVISYLSRWVVPGDLLGRAGKAAINFHPGPPEYPGIGCVNFALYDNASEYGVTCHHMAPRVDTGAIIAVGRFPILPSDGVETLLSRTHERLLGLFEEIAALLAEGRDLPASTEKWTRRPGTRRELDELGRITPEMSRDEVARRVRATLYGGWKPTVEIQGFEFELKTGEKRG